MSSFDAPQPLYATTTTADLQLQNTTDVIVNDSDVIMTSSKSCLVNANPFIMAWYNQVVYVIAFVIIVVVAAGGNAVVVWIVLAHRPMRTVTNYFLVNLAVSDALISLFNTLFNFVAMLYSDWPFGRAYCKFAQFIAPCTIAASVFTFVVIGLDR